MKKTLLKLFSLGVALFGTGSVFAQTMYVDEMFANVLRTANVRYDSNRSVNILFNTGYPNPTLNTSPLISVDLRCDIYTPVGSPVSARPTIIIAHTGSFLPAFVNRQVTGNKEDSAVVEMCTKLAKRGYNAVAVNYRLGWNAASTVQAEATEQLLKATYRGMQDIRNAIRYLRTNAATFGIDTSKIIVGGQGTGGYIALALGTVDRKAEIEGIAKFQRGDFTPMVSVDTLGDWNGIGGVPIFNVSGDANVASNAHMVFNYGGAMGDLSWLEAGNLPVVGAQVPSDPFAPYNVGNVIVPTTGTTVIPSAAGAGAVIPKANQVGVNNKINSKYLTDNISSALRVRANGNENLYPVATSVSLDGAPWEWWDRTSAQTRTTGVFYIYPLPANGRLADSLSFLTNPLMSKTKAVGYLDTLADFFSRRIAVQFDLVAASNDATKAFNLITPPNGTSALIKGDSDDVVQVRWGAGATTGFGDVSYKWKLSVADDIDFADPLAEVPVGARPELTLDFQTVSRLLGANGVAIGDSIDLVWTVEATVNGANRWSTDTFDLRLTRGQVTAVKQIVSANQYLSVFPNPATDVLNITLDNRAGSALNYAVIDVTGRTILNGAAKGNEFNISLNNVKPGLYFVQVNLADGRTATKRVVVE
ncbi:MAG: T9SS type A sorting domain-containing protein [Bacteroidia bacterium]|jgi:hypothetical protein|nr:T9SS type A sorting domain-containing protein [Bacteroidia bacterium]